MVSASSTTMQSLVMIKQRAPAIGAKYSICMFAVENCDKSKNRRKSLWAPLCTDSGDFLIKFHRSNVGPRT